MILICEGSTVFTILSSSFTENGDRIAANIISGVGFLGAGVIFEEGLTVRGNYFCCYYLDSCRYRHVNRIRVLCGSWIGLWPRTYHLNFVNAFRRKA
jgi:hypothetical protein